MKDKSVAPAGTSNVKLVVALASPDKLDFAMPLTKDEALVADVVKLELEDQTLPASLLLSVVL